MNNQPNNTKIIHDDGIVLALPAFDRIDVPFVMCYSELLASTSLIKMVDWMPGDSLVSRARNNLARRFLAGYPARTQDGGEVLVKHDWLLFLDTDLVFRPESVIQLYELAKERGPGIYAGTYPMKQLKPKVVCNPMPGCAVQPDGTVEVREAGTGFMLIHREVFDQMAEKFKDEILYSVDMGDSKDPQAYMNDFFSVGVRYDPIMKIRRYLSEDWYFCQRWRELGGKIIMQTKICCAHIGKFHYPGNPKDIMDAAEYFKAQPKPAAPANVVAKQELAEVVSIKVAARPV